MPAANPPEPPSTRKRRAPSNGPRPDFTQSAPLPARCAPQTPPRSQGAAATFATQAQTSPLKLTTQSQTEARATNTTAAEAKDILKMDNYGYWVGPMPMKDFLEKFVPETNTKAPSHRYNTEGVKQEKDIYKILIAGMNAGKKNTVYVDTSNHADRRATRGNVMKPDISSYARCIDLGDGRTQLDKAVLAVEDKFRLDLFDDKAIFGAFEPSTDSKRSVSHGQILRYMEEIHCRQDREFSFFLFIDVEHFRIIRIDRDGFIVTERTKWADPTADVTNNALNEFLHRFDNTTAKQMGYDPTVCDAAEADENIARARQALKEVIPEDMKPKGKNSEMPIRKIGVPCAKTEAEGDLRWFYIYKPTSAARGIRGRATRGYPAWDPVSDKIVFVKDCWRSDTGDVLKEADVIRELNEKGVEHAPTLICGGDLPGQRTVTGDYVSAEWNKGQRKAHHPRAHHRIAINFCQPLWKFRSARHLLQILYNAFTCHCQAVERCRKLHRDFSAWNILWDESSEEGVLSDWDLCAPMPPPGADESDPTINMMAQMPSKSGRPDRTGTWMFMSTLSLAGQPKLHDVQDDLEALFWVGVYIIILYTPYPEQDAIHMVDNIFTEYTFNGDVPIGGTAKSALLNRSHKFRPPHHPVLAGWIRTYSGLLDEWLTYKKNLAQQQESQEDTSGLRIRSRNNHIQPPDLRDHTVLDAEWSSLIKQGDKLGLFKDNGRCSDEEHDQHPFEVTALYRQRIKDQQKDAREAHASAQHSLAVSQPASAPVPRSSHQSQAGTSQSHTLMGPPSEPASRDADEEEAERGAKRQRTSMVTFKRTSSPPHGQSGRVSPGKGRGSTSD